MQNTPLLRAVRLTPFTLSIAMLALSGCTGEVSGSPIPGYDVDSVPTAEAHEATPLLGSVEMSDVAPAPERLAMLERWSDEVPADEGEAGAEPGAGRPDEAPATPAPAPEAPAEPDASEAPAGPASEAPAGPASEPAAPAASEPSEPAAPASEPAASAPTEPAASAAAASPSEPAASEPADPEPAAAPAPPPPPASEPAASEPEPAAPAAPASGAAPYPLPALPAAIAIRWPALPAITRTVTATTLDAALAAAATPGTRVHIEGAIGGRLEVRASDVELELAPGASCDVIFIGKGLSRVAVRGGEVEHVELELPAAWDGSAMVWDRALMTTDVTIDGVTANAADTAFFLRAAIRIALVNSHGTAGRYSVWMGDTGDFESEDVIVAGNTFSSAGPEATYRLVHVLRSVTVDNRIENHGGIKHNYRIHGRSDLNWASGNVLVNSGVMLGTMDSDSIGRQWFVGNTIHHTTPSLLEIELTTPSVVLRDNTIYSDVWTCLLCRETPAGWTVTGNDMLGYTAPPPS